MKESGRPCEPVSAAMPCRNIHDQPELIARGGGCAPNARAISSAQEEHDMHNVMAGESVSIGEESNTMDPIEQAARATDGFAGGAGHVRDAAAASDQAVRAGVELMQRNAETLQHALQC